MNDRERLVLAVCIGEWATVLRHIDVLEQVEPDEKHYSIRGRVRMELGNLCDLWSADQGNPVPDNERSVAEARAYCTEHQDRLDELLTGE